MNGVEQKEHKTALKRVEAAFRDAILAEVETRLKAYEDLTMQLDKLRSYVDTQDDRLVAQLKRYSDHGDKLLAEIMVKFMGKLTWQDRVRWILKGRVKG